MSGLPASLIFNRLAMMVLMSALIGVSNAQGIPVLQSEMLHGTVIIEFPASSFSVGDRKPFKVKVIPADGKPAPRRIRARFGMPYMHHWVTEEQAHDYSGEGVEFVSSITMPGVYRFRIWLDYDDGQEAKTAVDFKVMANHNLDPEVVTD